MPVEVTQEVINAFSMPRVEIGQTVLWYPPSLRKMQAVTGTVYRVSGRNVHLTTPTQGVKEAVRHIDDPKLKLNADQREMGAWDFTDADKLRRQAFEELQGEVRQLRRQITSLIADKGKPGEGLSKYQELRQRAVDAGIDFKGNPKTEWLEEQLATKANAHADAGMA